MARRALTNDRRVYLCTYDVAEDKRRTRLFELLLDHGEHVQYSVFLCTLTKAEVTGLQSSARELIHHEEDQLLVIDVGPEATDWQEALSCLGRSWTPQVRSMIV